jgi:alanine dehydrogenase
MMLVGLVTEIKPGERRCALTPAGARELTAAGHDVLVQAGAGDGSGFCDADYVQAGAQLAPDAATVWAGADLLLKVKEPIAPEYGHLRAGQVLFTYLHLAADPALTDALAGSGTTAVAYETVEDADGRLPLLRASPAGWAPRRRSSTARCGACASSTSSSTVARARSCPPPRRSRRSSSAPTS